MKMIALVRTLVERVTLNPETLECRVHYRSQ